MVQLRHPLLKLGSPHLIIYQQIKKNPGCTRNDIAKYACMDKNTVSRRAAELKNAGLIRETGYINDPSNGRKVAQLEINESIETGPGTDTVSVTLKVYRDSRGNYEVAEASDASIRRLGDCMTLVAIRKVKLKVPKNPDFELQTFASDKELLTVEGDYEIIDA